ncbi:MAG TPA: class I SAM-dependent methyltransferase [Terriglobales bacterium]|nr:class I SAM-dependent methyltransferase [Terriglobales bacterium]
MNPPTIRATQTYWDSTAENYDQIFSQSVIGRVQRAAVWHQLDNSFHPGMRILELNCGTGIDAVHLAERGVQVVACDLSWKMIDVARQRLGTTGLEALVNLRVLPIEEIDSLAGDAPFDGAFSNFSGLNCVQDISSVARSLARLLAPGAKILLCLVGRFSPWEMAWHLAHGKPRLALRSFRRRPTTHTLAVHYPSIRDMARMFSPEFQLRGWNGIGIAVPPSGLEVFARRAPGLVAGLAKIDRYLTGIPVFRSMGDCVLLQFELRRAECLLGQEPAFS